MSKQKSSTKLFYFILILIPMFFFLILEYSLRLFEYGENTSTWINITESHYGLNPNVARRYFNTVKSVPESIQDVFEVEKSKNTFRVFVLGGSSAAGFPYMPLGSFSRYIRQRLEHNYPNQKIEVVNLGLSAVNTYTILDLIPDVLDAEPDLILIYAGHNEYYGALGVGSMESLGRSRSIINFLIQVNKYKTTQLVRDGLKLILSLFSSPQSASGTLMSRMAKNKAIELDSETYKLGINQFHENMLDIVTLIKNRNVPVIISSLACNLKDQPPFISDNKKFNAKNIYETALEEYNKGNHIVADSLFRLAKDADQLRFRAPTEINERIKIITDSLSMPYADADYRLSNISPGGIIGDNLMIDHLHLNLKGYQELGEIFYDKMNELKILPDDIPKFEYSVQDSITRIFYKFSQLDSTISDFKIRLLRNDWPFIDPKRKKSTRELFQLSNLTDTIAYKFVSGEEEWEKSHRVLAATYIQKGEFEKGKKQIDILIHQYPLIVEYNKFVSEELIAKKEYDIALEYLERGNNLRQDAYFTKWLGIINLSNDSVDSAINYLEKSIEFSPNDEQVLYNLSGAYAKKRKFEKAYEIITKCLRINPGYSSAINLHKQLKAIVEK